MAKSQHQNYYDLSGGQQNRTTKYVRAKNECEFVKNGVYSKVGGIKQRGAPTIFGATLGTSAAVLGLAPFNYGGSTEKLMAYSNGKNYVYTSSWNSGVSVLTTPTTAEMVTFINKLFLVDIENPTQVSDDAVTYAATGSASGAPQAKFGSEFNARLYLANCKISSTYHRSRVYYSSIASSGAITWNTTEGTGDYFQIETDNGEYINGMGRHGNRLLVYKLNSLHKIIADDANNKAIVTVPNAVGTSSHKSILYHRLSGRTYSYHPKFGICAFDGANQSPISLAIQDFVDGVADPTIVVGWKSGYVLYWYVGTVTHPTDSSKNLTNGLFILDTAADKWAVGELPFAVKSSCIWYHGGVEDTFIGDATGNVYKWGDTTTSDNGTAIEFVVRTGIMWDVDVATIKRYHKSLLATDPQGCLSVRYRLFTRAGFSDWGKSKALLDPLEEIVYDNKLNDARGLQLEFKSMQAVSQPAVEGITNFYTPVATDEEREL